MEIVKFLLKIHKLWSSDVRNAWFGGNGYEVAFSFHTTDLSDPHSISPEMIFDFNSPPSPT